MNVNHEDTEQDFPRSVLDVYESLSYYTSQLRLTDNIDDIYKLFSAFISNIFHWHKHDAHTGLFVIDDETLDFNQIITGSDLIDPDLFEQEFMSKVHDKTVAWSLTNRKISIYDTEITPEFKQGLVVPVFSTNVVYGLMLVITKLEADTMPKSFIDALSLCCANTGMIIDNLKSHEQLANHRDNLQALVDERTSALEKANVKLTKLTEYLEAEKNKAEKAAESKSLFLANMSHEIRTPMNAILGYSKLLELTNLSGRQAEFVGTIKQSGNLLLAIIDDILDVAKLESNKIHLELIDFNLEELSREVIKMVLPKVEAKNIQVSLDIQKEVPSLVKGDPTRIRQILINLLGNAVKFTEEGDVSLRVSRVDSNKYKFIVKDTGIGIPSDKKDHIFDSFTQADFSTTREYGGTGLGLSICKALIELMGGEISVESEEGRGSSFTFTIQLEEAGSFRGNRSAVGSTDKVESSGTCSCKRKRILAAEDNHLNKDLLVRYLTILKVEFTIVDNGQEAVDILRQHPEDFDLCLMDLQMPVMNGFEATRIIKTEINSGLPVIALTAAVLEEDRLRAEKAGVDAFVAKPIELNMLEVVIRDVLSKG